MGGRGAGTKTKKSIGLACALILSVASSVLYRATLSDLSVRASSIPQEGPSKVGRRIQGSGSRPTVASRGSGRCGRHRRLRGSKGCRGYGEAARQDSRHGVYLRDVVYPRGSDSDFANCYEKTWGRHKARTCSALGNHEYGIKDAAGYFRYFGAAAGEPGKGYYSYDLGAWYIVVINSNCDRAGGCKAGSPQEHGCAASWPRIARPARWPSGITHCSARASTRDTRCAQKCGLSGKRSMKWARKSS
jgi:hypothetical protein